jgi:hypothetical protein
MPNTEKTYNGWTNYATWRVNLEMFDGYDPDGTPVTADSLGEMTDEWLSNGCGNEVTLDYARAFLNDVNWQEIADAINEANELTDTNDEA